MRSAVINLFRDLIDTWASFFSKATPAGVLMCGERGTRRRRVGKGSCCSVQEKKRKWSNVVRKVHKSYGVQARYITPVYFTCEAEDEFNSVLILRDVRMRRHELTSRLTAKLFQHPRLTASLPASSSITFRLINLQTKAWRAWERLCVSLSTTSARTCLAGAGLQKPP